VPEGAGQLVALNRWAYDVKGSGQYVRPDVLIDLGPGSRQWLDGKFTFFDPRQTSVMMRQFDTYYRFIPAQAGYAVTPHGSVLVPNRTGGKR
jgi:hypothetical protein